MLHLVQLHCFDSMGARQRLAGAVMWSSTQVETAEYEGTDCSQVETAEYEGTDCSQVQLRACACVQARSRKLEAESKLAGLQKDLAQLGSVSGDQVGAEEAQTTRLLQVALSPLASCDCDHQDPNPAPAIGSALTPCML